MEKRGHHICRVGGYEIRQRITNATQKSGGSSEITIYKGKKLIEGKLPSVIVAAQSAYDMQKKNGTTPILAKKIVTNYEQTKLDKWI